MAGERVRGTVVCAVTDGDEGDDALELGLELSERLGLRVVLAQAVPPGRREARDAGDGDYERVQHRLAQLAREHGVIDLVERRVAVGDPAVLLGRIAAEEAADVVVVGAAKRRRNAFDASLAHELETETPAPVVVALPGKRRTRRHGRRR